MYDTVAQYGQVLGDPVDDWHPPVMVRLWQLLHPLGPGTAPMFVLQAALYALGFALIVAALVRSSRWRAAIAAAVLALSPLLLGWQMVVLKDTQMLGALIASIGIVAHWRLRGRSLPRVATAAMVLLIAYATLVRANASFATVPLAVLLLPARRSALASLALALVGGAAILLLQPLINHGLLHAEPSDVAKSEPIFDLAGIAVRTPEEPSSAFTASERQEIIDRHCSKAFFWDSLTDPTGCADATERAMKASAGQLYLQLAREAALHPIAYAHHRLAHWNSTERWLIAPGLPDAGPPDEVEPNDLGLASPTSPIVAIWQDAAAAEATTPFGWPIVWTLIGLALFPAAWRRRRDPAGSLALALLASAITLEASFLAISIASDLRYHLWPMAASPLALILLSDDIQLKRLEWIGAIGVLALLVGGGLLTRSTLPTAPDSYEGMITAASG
jgi:hypothetical protein